VCDVADVRYAITGTGADKQRHVDVRDDTRSSRDASADGRELRGYDRRCAQRL
jgi:hypothetical protein